MTDEIQAGRETDRRVAEALGYEVMEADEFVWMREPEEPPDSHPDPKTILWEWWHKPSWWARQEDGWTTLPHFSADIGAAWELWCKMIKSNPYHWAIFPSTSGKMEIEYYGKGYIGYRENCAGDWHVEALPPLAICRAFLKTVKAHDAN